MAGRKLDILADNLSNIIRIRGISIAEICRETGINRQQFSRYLSGKFLPSTTNMLKICDYFEIDTGSLLKEQTGAVDYENSLRLPEQVKSLIDFSKNNTCPEFLDGVYFGYRIGFGHDLVLKNLFVVRTIGNYRIQDEMSVLKYKETGNFSINPIGPKVLRHTGSLSGFDGIFFFSSIDKIAKSAQNFGMYRRSLSFQGDYLGQILSHGYNNFDVLSRVSYLQKIDSGDNIIPLLRTCGYYDKNSNFIDPRILQAIT